MADLEPGSRLGAYRLEERLGEGGMGVVFRAVREPESRSIWPAAIIVSLAMLTIGIGAFFLGRDQATRTSKAVVGGTEETVVGGTVANTPSELSGGVVGGLPTNAAGISAGSSSLAVAASPDVTAVIIAARNTADADPGKLGSGTAGNTPSELSGGMFERYGRHQRI